MYFNDRFFLGKTIEFVARYGTLNSKQKVNKTQQTVKISGKYK